MCFNAFYVNTWSYCIPLSFKEGEGYSPPSPSPKFATVQIPHSKKH